MSYFWRKKKLNFCNKTNTWVDFCWLRSLVFSAFIYSLKKHLNFHEKISLKTHFTSIHFSFTDMRIFYCRRLFFPLFILSILFMFFLIFQASTNKTPDVSLWALYKSSGNCTDQSISTSSIPSSIQFVSVPPNYLVIPYREFALRTSISCKAFKLDNPANNPDNLYPKYSKYLRGRFPYVLPDVNITFDDVETFYTDTLVNTITSNSSIDTSFAKNITFENIPYEFENGLWHPVGVISAQRTAIIVPLQGREYNAKVFLLNMHAFFRRQQLTYTIVLVEQVSKQRFEEFFFSLSLINGS